MSVKINTLELDDVTYTFVEASFYEAEKRGRGLLGFADGLIKIDFVKVKGKTEPNFNLNAGALLDNLGGDKFEDLRDFVFKHIRVKKGDAGVPFASMDDQGTHLSAHRDHYAKILIEGLKFHFLAFYPDGQKFVKLMLEKATAQAVAQAKEM